MIRDRIDDGLRLDEGTMPEPDTQYGRTKPACRGLHPVAGGELVEDRSLVPNAIQELLRYELPSPVQARYVTRDVEHHRRVVPEGSAVILLNGSGNRDERKFRDPDRFDVHRTIDHHLAFGYGIHFCLGAALARLEAGRARRGPEAVPAMGGRL